MEEFDIQLNVPKDGFGQYTSTTCWFAAYRMLYAWKGKDQRTIGPALEKAGLNLKALRNRGLLESEFGTAMGALDMLGWKGITIYEQSAGNIAQLLKQWGPLWVAFEWRGEASAGHAAVLVGYDKRAKTFRVHNPYNRFEPGQVESEWLTLAQFRAWIRSAKWAVQCMKP
jgi:hypothetical protein